MQISDRCYAITGLAYLPPWSVNSGFIVGDDFTLVVDTGATLLAAQTIYGYAASVRRQNKLLVVNTEKHFDHIGGNFYFRQKGIDIYGHKAIRRRPQDLEADIADLNACIPNPVRQLQQEAKIFYAGTQIENPNKPVSSDMRLDLGGIEVDFILTPGHTDTNLSVWLADDGVLFAGDCMINGYIPNLDAGAVEEWQQWWVSLDKVAELKPQFVVPGHGNVLSGATLENEMARVRATLQAAMARTREPT